MLIKPLRQFYLHVVAYTAVLTMACIWDAKMCAAAVFYPDGQANTLTWLYWGLAATTAAPWLLLLVAGGVALGIDQTVGIPSKMHPARRP